MDKLLGFDYSFQDQEMNDSLFRELAEKQYDTFFNRIIRIYTYISNNVINNESKRKFFILQEVIVFLVYA